MSTTPETDGDRAVQEVAAAVRSVPTEALDAVAAMLAGAGTPSPHTRVGERDW